MMIVFEGPHIVCPSYYCFEGSVNVLDPCGCCSHSEPCDYCEGSGIVGYVHDGMKIEQGHSYWSRYDSRRHLDIIECVW